MTSTPRYPDYTRREKRSARICGQKIDFFSKPGLPDWEAGLPSASLLAENAEIAAASNALWLGCGHGAAAAALAIRFPNGKFTWMDINFIALQMAVETLQVNQATNIQIHAGISLTAEKAGSFEAVLLDLPKSRKLARRWLAEAFALLRVGGYLYLAGANDQGIEPAVKDAAGLFNTPTILAYKKGNRVARFLKSEGPLHMPDWSQQAGIKPGTWYEILAQTKQGPIKLCSLPGIFSFDRLDPGTQALLESMPELADEKVLDLGCGYGIIGIAAALDGATHVDLVDVNLLAVTATAENLAAHSLTRATVFPSDGLSAVSQQRYTLIATNPPFHTGHPVDYQVAEAFIQQSWEALENGGQLWLVANQFIRYDRLMRKVFGRVKTVIETGRFHVLQAVK